ncbi:MAG: hypothetical protein ACREUG_02480 [Steroidobacteraceae bacterium]
MSNDPQQSASPTSKLMSLPERLRSVDTWTLVDACREGAAEIERLTHINATLQATECHDPEHAEAMRHLAGIMDTEAAIEQLRTEVAQLRSERDAVRRLLDRATGVRRAVETSHQLTSSPPSGGHDAITSPQPIPISEIVSALERESGNCDTDRRWRAATLLREIDGWTGRTLMCRIDQRPSRVETTETQK